MVNIKEVSYDSGCPELDKSIREWLNWDKNDITRIEIEKLANAGNWSELKNRLGSRMAFGTAGLRGVMQAGYNSMNDLVVIQTAQGLAQYIKECFPNSNDRQHGIVLGYDGRYNSKRFAELTACVFLTADIPVWLYSEMVATPFVPFAIVEKQCLAGIMVTASHNPKEDNGYKVYWNNGAQIISPHDKNIQNSILRNLDPLESAWNLDVLKSTNLNDPLDEMVSLYYKKLLENIPKEFLTENSHSDTQFVYTAMHGVGYPYIKKGFKVTHLQPVIAVEEQCSADPEFPTVKFPNPEEGKSSLVLSIKLADKTGCQIILANDPDADRLACAEYNPESNLWKVFTGNEIGALLGWWSIVCYKKNNVQNCENLDDCYLLASTVSSKILNALAKKEKLNFIETLTGFKWMGNKSVELIAEGKTVLFAFEEAIGFMFSTIVLDKDGVSAACHLATMASYLKSKENMSLTQKLNQLYQIYGFHCTNNSYFLCYEPKIITKLFEKLRNFNGIESSYPKSILNGKYSIVSVRDLTTGIDTSQPDNKAILPISKSTQMITFTFENGVVVTLRTSGTEPKVKYYAEMCAKPEEKNWAGLRTTLDEMVDAIVEEFLQPTLNNLIARSE